MTSMKNKRSSTIDILLRDLDMMLHHTVVGRDARPTRDISLRMEDEEDPHDRSRSKTYCSSSERDMIIKSDVFLIRKRYATS